MRITADGMVRNCLFGTHEWSLVDALRSGADDREIERLLRAAVWAKASGHKIGDPSFQPPIRPMSQIGG